MDKSLTQEDIQQMVNFSQIMAQKVVLTLLRSTVRHNSLTITSLEEDPKVHKIQNCSVEDIEQIEPTTEEAERLCAKITEFQECNITGSTEMIYDTENISVKLKIQLCIVKKDYNLSIEVPKINEKKVYELLGFLIQVAITYYEYFAREHVELMENLTKFVSMRKELDLNHLKVDPANTTLYLDDTLDKRIGIVCYYVQK